VNAGGSLFKWRCGRASPAKAERHPGKTTDKLTQSMPHAGFPTLVEALLAAPPHRPFITMWYDEDESDTVTFGEFIRLAQAQLCSWIVSIEPLRHNMQILGCGGAEGAALGVCGFALGRHNGQTGHQRDTIGQVQFLPRSRQLHGRPVPGSQRSQGARRCRTVAFTELSLADDRGQVRQGQPDLNG